MLKSLRHVYHAAGYSLAGIRYLFATELAARIELVATALALAWFVVLGRSTGEIVTVALLFCGLFCVEALNTAIEVVVDRISPETSEFARMAKDLGSAATFFVQLAIGLYVLAVTADQFGIIVL